MHAVYSYITRDKLVIYSYAYNNKDIIITRISYKSEICI